MDVLEGILGNDLSDADIDDDEEEEEEVSCDNGDDNDHVVNRFRI